MSGYIEAAGQGAAGALGAYVTAQYLIPAAEATAKKATEIATDVIHDHGGSIVSSGMGIAIGWGLGGPVGAGIVAAIGWMSGRDSDKEAAETLKNTGVDGRCSIY